MNCTTLANRLNLAMAVRDVSTRALTAKVNVTQYTINAIRQRALAPDPVMLEKIAGALDLPMDYFTTEDDEKAMAFLRKDGQETNEELKQAIRDTGDKLDQVVTNVKAMFYDFLSHMYMDGRQENEIKIALGLMSELTGKLSGAVKDM